MMYGQPGGDTPVQNSVSRNPGGRGGGSEPPNPKLYVTGLPVDIDKESLDYVFRAYGAIEELLILKAKNGKDRASCIVRYGTTQEAQSCVQAMETGYEIR